MTKEEILKKAKEKATKNGWKVSFDMMPNNNHPVGMANLIIFRHDFAKAFWGEENKFTNLYVCEEIYDPELDEDEVVYLGKYLPMWQYHLQQMVLEEEPIKYLERFLDK